MADESLNVDSVLEHAGNFGRYQIILMVLFSFINFLSAFHYFGQTFISVVPEYQCDINVYNADIKVEQCDVLVVQNESTYTYPCTTGWTYNTEKIYGFIGIIEELNWVCNNDWKPILGQSVFFIGSVIGSLGLGVLADMIGRLHVLVIANLFGLVGNIFTAFSNNIELYATSRFLSGLATDANFFMMYIIIMEYMKPSMRTFGLNLCIGIFYCVACVIVPWTAVLVGDWRTLLYFIGIPHILVVGFYILVPESAQWLISKGKTEKAIKCFKKVAKMNGRVIQDQVFVGLKKYCNERISMTSKHESFLGLLRTKNLRRKTLILIFKSMVMTLCYDAISRNVNGLDYSPFVIFSITSSTILPACLFILAVQDRVGRKALASGSLLIGGLFTATSGTIQAFIKTPDPLTILSLAFVARLCITIAYNSGAQYAVELIPTVVRGQGVSLIHVLGYAASFFSPQVLYLSNFWKAGPDVILGSLMVSGAIACLFLPETLNKTLPVTLQDGEEFGEGERVFDFHFLNTRTESTTSLFRINSIYT